MHAITFDFFDWLPRRPDPRPPDTGAIEALRREMQTALATERTAREGLHAQLSETRVELGTARRETAEAKGYAEMLNNVTKNQDRMLQEQGSLVSTLQEQQRQALDDKQHQSRLIAELRNQMTGQQAEIAELRERLRVTVEEMAATRNQALVSEAKARILEEENHRLRERLRELGVAM